MHYHELDWWFFFFFLSLLDIPERQRAVINVGVAFSHQKSSVFTPRLRTEFLQQSLGGLSALSETPMEPGLGPVQIHTAYRLTMRVEDNQIALLHSPDIIIHWIQMLGIVPISCPHLARFPLHSTVCFWISHSSAYTMSKKNKHTHLSCHTLNHRMNKCKSIHSNTEVLVAWEGKIKKIAQHNHYAQLLYIILIFGHQ